MTNISTVSFEEVKQVHPNMVSHEGYPIGHILAEGYEPALVLTKNEGVPDSYRADDIGALVLNAMRREYRGQKFDRFQEHRMAISGSRNQLIDTPRHLDGLGVEPFIQTHTNHGPVASEVLLYVQRTEEEAQRDVLEHMHGRKPSHDQTTFFDKLPASVRFADTIGQYRAVLHPGDTLIFRNGFMPDPDTRKELVTHKFHSVDEEGVRVPVARDVSVGNVRHVKRESRSRLKFGKR